MENFELFQVVDFELKHSSNSNGTKYLLISDTSSEDIGTSKTFADVATAGRHRGLSTSYIKRKLFQ